MDLRQESRQWEGAEVGASLACSENSRQLVWLERREQRREEEKGWGQALLVL